MSVCNVCGGSGEIIKEYVSGARGTEQCKNCHDTGKQSSEVELTEEQRKEICPQCGEQTTNCFKDCLMFDRIKAIITDRLSELRAEIKAELLAKLPKVFDINEQGIKEHIKHGRVGFNQAITEVTKLVEGIK